MNELSVFAGHPYAVLIWGLVASALMATLLEGAQLLGHSRMSLPLLFGAAFTNDRRWAIGIGYVLYILGGWLFALIYAYVLYALGLRSPVPGAIGGMVLGVLHGLFLVTVFLPLLPYVHPRLASDYDGDGALAKMEPPGPLGLNYGFATPIVTILALALFGAVVGLGVGLSY